MILITGGAGYIGSHCSIEFLRNGFDVIVFDNFSLGHKKIIDNIMFNYPNIVLFQGDLRNKKDLDIVFRKYQIDAVVHLAAFSQVKQSILEPEVYYENNVLGTLNLLSSMVKNNVLKIIFSSSAAIYGEPCYIPVDETHPKNPINTYGKTKLVVENIMDDYDLAYGLKSIRLRYFNVLGANYKENIGEWHDVETHLLPNIIKSVLKSKFKFKIFGANYPTFDGTCIRDYIDVEDIAEAHRLAYNYLNKNNKTDVFNLGSQDGVSVKQMCNLVSKILDKKISIEYTSKRQGDCAILLADSSKAKKILNWKARNSISDSIYNAYQWEKILESFS